MCPAAEEAAMLSYEILLGVDRAARDTGQRIRMRVRESDPLKAAIRAEQIADRGFKDPATMYTHAMQVRAVRPLPAVVALPRAPTLALAA
jgi:hypothetical protein